METQDLRKAGLKVTLPRVRILEILEEKHGMHMTAEDVYKELLKHNDDIGLATVYRTLQLLADHGCIPVSLGPRVLRAETAPVVALAAIHALWGDFRPRS